MIIGLFVGARILFWWAATPGEWTDDAVGSPVAYASLLLRGIHRSPLDLLVSVLMLAGIVVALVDPVWRYAGSLRGRRSDPSESLGARIRCLVMQVIAGAVVLAIQAGVLAIVGDTVENATVNLLRLTLSPWSSARSRCSSRSSCCRRSRCGWRS